MLRDSKAVLGGFKVALGFGLGSGPPPGYRERCTAHSTDTETPQNTARIDRNDNKVPICRGFVRAVLAAVIARKSGNIDRKRKYHPQYRPRTNPRFCRSFVS